MTSQQRKEETKAFFFKVKDKFQDEREKSEEFLKVMKDFKAKRINLAGVVAKLKQLFKGHRDLILAFNNLLSIENKIKMSWTDEIAEAAKFLNKLKTRLQGDDRAYKLFVRMLRTRNTKIVDEIATLLQDHADLLEEFTQYITETSGATFTHFTSVQNTLVDGGSSAITTEQQMHVDHREKRDRRKWENDNRDYDHNGSGEHLSPKQKSSHVVEPLCDANENFGMRLMSSACCDQNDMNFEQCTPDYRIECSPAPTKMSIQPMDYGHDKPKVTVLSMDPDKKSGIFLKRNLRKYASSDEFSIEAWEGLRIIDGLKSKIACDSSKVSYVLNTEDVLIRTRSKRRTLHQNDSGQEQAMSSYICSSRVLRFRKMLSSM